MEEYTPQTQEEKTQQIKRWFQDNLRIIVSVVIVVAIAGGIYSYSNRGTSEIAIDSSSDLEQMVKDQDSSDVSSTIVKGQDIDNSANKDAEVSVSASSQETENSFVETAGKGDGLTTLARQAAANYLEKNPDSALTKEHKIYIEDYLRKNVTHSGGVHIGTSVEFSKDLIQKAVTQSKNLNEKQLKNLQKYSNRVSNL
ncbi:MAG: hypothetical protein HGA61_01745 [Candidatus Moranbacteria bacterium]|nr:hypothetical protein [Candidatus Moranbacteria bacterium]